MLATARAIVTASANASFITIGRIAAQALEANCRTRN
jgi:hypothetical protein